MIQHIRLIKKFHPDEVLQALCFLLEVAIVKKRLAQWGLRFYTRTDISNIF